jgi:hypothetical protein
MAIRNDFAPGEVLAAADLNDTFGSKANYPSGGSNGDLLTKSGTTTAWAAPTPQGLTLITSDTFTTVSSISINGCFTSTYRSYRILIDHSASSAATNTFRLRASSTDATTNYQYGLQAFAATGQVDSGNTTTGTDWRIGTTDTTNNFLVMDVNKPQLAARTDTLFLFSGFVSAGATGSGRWLGHGIHTTASAYDGFSYLTASGTITGTIRVYGYRD